MDIYAHWMEEGGDRREVDRLDRVIGDGLDFMKESTEKSR